LILYEFETHFDVINSYKSNFKSKHVD